MVELRWAIPSSTTTERPRLQYRVCPPIVQIGGPAGWSEWLEVPYVVVPQEPPRKITSLAEFCAEATRTGLTAETLAAALSKRPEFADCLPGADGVGGNDGR